MSEELKPCPFCGSEPKLKRHDDTFIVVCEHHEWSKLNADGIRTAGDIAIYADMQGEYNFDTHELEYSPEEIERCKNAAIETWNTRAERTSYCAVPEGYLVVPVPDKTVTQISISSGRFDVTDFVDTYSRVLEKHVQDEIVTKSLENCGYVKERTCHKNPPDALVVYKGDEVIGTFDSYEQAAEFLGVKVSSVKFMASPAYQRRKGSNRPTGRTCVERIYFEEGEEW